MCKWTGASWQGCAVQLAAASWLSCLKAVQKRRCLTRAFPQLMTLGEPYASAVEVLRLPVMCLLLHTLKTPHSVGKKSHPSIRLCLERTRSILSAPEMQQIEFIFTSRTQHRDPRNIYKHKERDRERKTHQATTCLQIKPDKKNKQTKKNKNLEPKNVTQKLGKHRPEGSQTKCTSALTGERSRSQRPSKT